MLVLGSQTMLEVGQVPELVAAVKKLGIPTWLQGMCRGLLGAESDLYAQHLVISDVIINPFRLFVATSAITVAPPLARATASLSYWSSLRHFNYLTLQLVF